MSVANYNFTPSAAKNKLYKQNIQTNESTLIQGMTMYTLNGHRMLVRASAATVLSPAPETCDFKPGKTFQNRNVSSPAPVTMVCPSGDMARKSTRNVCPVSVVSLLMLGYLQTTIWF